MFPILRTLRRVVRPALAAAALAVPLAGYGACSRDIRVPVAPTGFSVIVSGSSVSGAFPDMLRELGQKMGCKFVFPVVPRARLSFMFLNSGEADLLLPASRSAERDKQAIFVSMMTLKMALISLKQREIKTSSVKELLAGRRLQGIVVRSYVFGDEYNALIQGLDAQNRVFYANSLETVARMLQAGRGDFTLIAPSIFLSALSENPELETMRGKLDFNVLDGLPPAESGVYISKRSLSAVDQAELYALLEAARKGVFLKSFKKYYPADMLQFVVLPH